MHSFLKQLSFGAILLSHASLSIHELEPCSIDAERASVENFL